MCDVAEVNILANPGRGVTVIKTDEGVDVVGFAINDMLTLESDKGKTVEVKPLKKDRVPRGSKGRQVFSRKEKVARIVHGAAVRCRSSLRPKRQVGEKE